MKLILSMLTEQAKLRLYFKTQKMKVGNSILILSEWERF